MTGATRRGGRARAAAAARPSRAHAARQRAARPPGLAVVTVSDTRRGVEDRSGAAIEAIARAHGARIATRAWVRDDAAAIRRAVRAALARADVDAVVLTGGTGPAPRDVTVAAVAPLVERDLPGFGECFRMLSFRQVGSAAWLSSAGAAVADGRLLVCLPGSVAAVELAMEELLMPELVHALRMLGRLKPEE